MGNEQPKKPTLTRKWSTTGKDGIYTDNEWTCDPEFTFDYRVKGYEGPLVGSFEQLEATQG